MEGAVLVKMTPVQIFEYKQKWLSTGDALSVQYHSDWRGQAIDFCKSNFEKYQWYHSKFTGVYEDTMYFEQAGHHELFDDYMKIVQKKP